TNDRSPPEAASPGGLFFARIFGPMTERWINMVESNPDPSREPAFNEWYDNTHVPDILQTPGFVRARRFLNKEFRDGRGEFLAIYEIETDDLEQTMKVRLARREAETKAGRSSVSRNNLTRPVWRDVLWKPVLDKTA